MQISANLGFLFTELPLADAVRAAQDAGFDAVEFHDQAQDAPLQPLCRALAETRLPVLSLNTYMGPSKGRASVSQAKFARDFDAAEAVAADLDARAIHVTAGIGGTSKSYHASLAYALDHTFRDILIEPICAAAIPGYHLSSLVQAEAVLADLAHPRLKLLFDWYHIATMLGPDAALASLARLGPAVGHVQLSRIPDRGEPAPDRLPELTQIFALLRRQGRACVGLEYVSTSAIAPIVAALRDV